VGVVDPDGDSEMGTETRMGGGDWQRGGGGSGIWTRDEVGRQSRGGGLGGVMMRVGTTTSEISAEGSVWVETDT